MAVYDKIRLVWKNFNLVDQVAELSGLASKVSWA